MQMAINSIREGSSWQNCVQRPAGVSVTMREKGEGVLRHNFAILARSLSRKVLSFNVCSLCCFLFIFINFSAHLPFHSTLPIAPLWPPPYCLFLYVLERSFDYPAFHWMPPCLWQLLPWPRMATKWRMPCLPLKWPFRFDCATFGFLELVLGN